MNLNHAHKYKQQGISLIELIVASSISLIAIATVGSIYLAGNKMAVARTSQLMIKQDINDPVEGMINRTASNFKLRPLQSTSSI